MNWYDRILALQFSWRDAIDIAIVAFVIYYTLNHAVGPTRTSLVAYIAPVFAVVYGVTLRGESFGVATAVGIALIVGGSWLAANAGPRPARVREVVAGASSPAG